MNGQPSFQFCCFSPRGAFRGYLCCRFCFSRSFGWLREPDSICRLFPTARLATDPARILGMIGCFSFVVVQVNITPPVLLWGSCRVWPLSWWVNGLLSESVDISLLKYIMSIRFPTASSFFLNTGKIIYLIFPVFRKNDEAVGNHHLIALFSGGLCVSDGPCVERFSPGNPGQCPWFLVLVCPPTIAWPWCCCHQDNHPDQL